MVEKRLEPEVEEALQCIEKNENFILTGGAGSGKTYSLVTLIEEIGSNYPSKTIVCITYTNNGVSEIRSRISNKNLYVRTIHEFIWSLIRKYQDEIKEILVELINSEEPQYSIFRKPVGFEGLITAEFFQNNVNYDEYYNLNGNSDNTISHDHVLLLAERMFSKYEKLCDILIDVADFIFIDEYQDTNPYIVKILLEHLENRNKNNIIGFFGDSMQAIYDEGVGKITNEKIKRINKIQNRRNPLAVINFANEIRDDGLIQQPSKDENAPNMEEGEVIEGTVKFIYGDTDIDLQTLMDTAFLKDLNFKYNDKETKILNLVHSANASASGFEKLYTLYHKDLIYDLINRIRKKINSGDLIIEGNETFHQLIKEANITIGRGNNKKYLLNIIQQDQESSNDLGLLNDSSWTEVDGLRINSESLLAYKFNGSKGTFESNSKRDNILKQLDQIYEVSELYKNKDYNAFLRKTNFRINSYDDKKNLYEEMEFLDNAEEKTIEEVIDKGSQILSIPRDNFDEFVNAKGRYLWHRIKDIKFIEYINSIQYLKEELPYATQHSIKGSEFDNVLIVLNNHSWNKYNFEYIFTGAGTESVVDRTRNLFYVCVTRAKKNLVLYMPTTDSQIINKVENTFGNENTIDIEDLVKNT